VDELLTGTAPRIDLISHLPLLGANGFTMYLRLDRRPRAWRSSDFGLFLVFMRWYLFRRVWQFQTLPLLIGATDLRAMLTVALS